MGVVVKISNHAPNLPGSVKVEEDFFPVKK